MEVPAGQISGDLSPNDNKQEGTMMKTILILIATAAVWAFSDSTPARIIVTAALVLAVGADISARVRTRHAR